MTKSALTSAGTQRHSEAAVKRARVASTGLDAKNGGWFNSVDADYRVLGSGKTSLWKCPNHHSPACSETLDRLEHLW